MADNYHCEERNEAGDDESVVGAEGGVASTSCEEAQSYCDAVDDAECNACADDTQTDWVGKHGSVLDI